MYVCKYIYVKRVPQIKSWGGGGKSLFSKPLIFILRQTETLKREHYLPAVKTKGPKETKFSSSTPRP